MRRGLVHCAQVSSGMTKEQLATLASKVSISQAFGIGAAFTSATCGVQVWMTGQTNQILLKKFRTFRAKMNEDAYQFEEKQRRFHEEVHRWLDKVILDLALDKREPQDSSRIHTSKIKCS